MRLLWGPTEVFPVLPISEIGLRAVASHLDVYSDWASHAGRQTWAGRHVQRYL